MRPAAAGGKSAPAMAVVDRKFVRLDEGLVHVRRSSGSGQGLPLVMLHASPGSSRVLAPLMQVLAAMPGAPHFLAPDMPGNGDSDAFAPDDPDIGWYAAALMRLLDRLDIARFDLYGTHTGARIACEVAAAFPGRVNRVVLDGFTDYPDETRDLFLQHYAPAMQPDDYGRHLIWAFNYVRDQALHFPHFMRDPGHRLMTRAVPSAADLHLATVDVLKGLTSYHKAYHAAFRYRACERLPAIGAPAMLLSAEGELPELRAATELLATLVPQGTVREVGRDLSSKAAAMARFLAFGGSADS